MASKLKIEAETISRLNRLCELGARPPVIQAMLPSVPEQMVRNQWEMINGESSKKGRLPNVPEWYFSTYIIKLQSSFVAFTWRQLIAGNMHYIDAYIATYEIYTRTFETPLLSFDRVWFLGRILSAKMIATTACDKCASAYIHNKDNLINHKHCPVCRVYAPKAAPKEAAKGFVLAAKTTKAEPFNLYHHNKTQRSVTSARPTLNG